MLSGYETMTWRWGWVAAEASARKVRMGRRVSFIVAVVWWVWVERWCCKVMVGFFLFRWYVCMYGLRFSWLEVKRYMGDFVVACVCVYGLWDAWGCM